MRRLLVMLTLAFLAALSAAPGARAIGLDVLEDGGSLTSGNGRLVFDDFEVVATGSVSSDLSLYEVVALVDGFEITGLIGASGRRGFGELQIQYTVTASSPITAAKLRFNGVTTGRGSYASVTESFEEPADVELYVYAKHRKGRVRRDSVNLEEFSRLRVTDKIVVESSRRRGLAAISWIAQRFETIAPPPAPEPATLLLLGTALAGVAVARSRRA